MSVVPIRYRDWWDDWDHQWPLRPPRWVDPPAFRDDWMAPLWQPWPSWFRSSQLRPWDSSWRSFDSDGTLSIDRDKFEVVLDVPQFTPSEITVKSTDRDITVEGRHEHKPNENGYVSRHFVRRYQLPVNVRPYEVTSSLSTNGVLTVTGPVAQRPAITSSARTVPVWQTGPNYKAISS